MLDTAVAVGLISPITAQALLSGDGGDERMHFLVNSRRSAAATQFQSAGRQQNVPGRFGQLGTRLAALRSGARCQDEGMDSSQGVRAPKSNELGGAKNGLAIPAVSPPETCYLHYDTSLLQQKALSTGAGQDHWLGPQPQFYARAADSQSSYRLQRKLDSERPHATQLAGKLPLQCALLPTGDQRQQPQLYTLGEPSCERSVNSSGGALVSGKTLNSCPPTVSESPSLYVEEGLVAHASELHYERERACWHTKSRNVAGC